MAGGLSRTFTVSRSFTVSNVSLGLNISHNSRGNVAALLYAPDGSFVVFMQPSFDSDNDYDILLSSDSDGGPNPQLDDNSSDPVGEPYFARLVNQPNADFYTGDAAGTWTLVLCDVVNGTTGTFNRARLMLTSAETAAPVCTGTTSYDWATNGNNNPFSSATRDGVTLSLTSTRDLTSDGANTNGRVNFTTQTGVFGAQAGYFIMQFDDGANGGPQSPEQVLLESSWSFSSPVRELSWTNLDIDNGSWEDYVRLTARDANGAMVPYQLIPGTAHQPAGDVLESDVGNIPDNSSAGNATYLFDGPVSSVTLEYMRGDDFGNPNSQRIGIGNVSWCAFDFGDAPNSYGDALSNGPRHALGDRSLYLGANPPDGEADGQPGAAATGDDASQVAGVDDEDGVSGFPACPGDGTYSVDVDVTNQSGSSAYLVGYVDWDRDGAFNTTSERSATATVPSGTSGGTVAVTWSSVPADCGGSASTYARFRLTTSQTRAESPTDGAGLQAPDGEVEDYQLSVGTLPVTVAWVESARAAGGGVDLRFATATENRNVAFRIWDLTRGRSPRLLATVPSEVVDSFEPQEYAVELGDEGVGRVGIEDVAVDGEGRLHGPFAVGSTVGLRPERAPIDWPAIERETGVVSLAARMKAAEAAGSATVSPDRSGTAAVRERFGIGPGGFAADALLLVREAGIHRVTYEDLAAAGVDFDGVPSALITLVDEAGDGGGGRAVPMTVLPQGRFGPGSAIEFLADPHLTLESPVDVYTLRARTPGDGVPPGPRVVDLPGATGRRLGTTRATVRQHPDREFSPSAPNGDPWYDARILALGGPGTETRTLRPARPGDLAGEVPATERPGGADRRPLGLRPLRRAGAGPPRGVGAQRRRDRFRAVRRPRSLARDLRRHRPGAPRRQRARDHRPGGYRLRVRPGQPGGVLGRLPAADAGDRRPLRRHHLEPRVDRGRRLRFARRRRAASRWSAGSPSAGSVADPVQGDHSSAAPRPCPAAAGSACRGWRGRSISPPPAACSTRRSSPACRRRRPPRRPST